MHHAAAPAGAPGSMDTYKKFNRAILEFIRDLATSFPQVEGFRRVYASTNLLSTLRPCTIQELFQKHVGPLSHLILQRDENFFLAKDYSKEVLVVGEGVEFVDMIKSIWQTLDAANKDNIWRHMEVLVAVSKCLELQQSSN